ncbi:ranaspumin-like isoform X2 [Engystomops pustulosus]|uniref:ranaspumin-like isoform X2 n=1 Tax=Engystomops pustulosus TaxID=76066 RepID=UPI003AFAF6FE
MKIIILFALAGLSLAHEWCYSTSGITLLNSQCLEFARNHAPYFSENLAIFLCEYDNKLAHSQDYYKNATKKLTIMLKCSGCNLDVFRFIDEELSLEEILTNAGKTLEELLHILFHLLDGLELSKGETDLLCKLADHSSISSHLRAALKKDPSPLSDKLMASISEGDRVAITTESILKVLENLTKHVGLSLAGLLETVMDGLMEVFGPDGISSENGCLLKTTADTLLRIKC